MENQKVIFRKPVNDLQKYVAFTMYSALRATEKQIMNDAEAMSSLEREHMLRALKSFSDKKRRYC